MDKISVSDHSDPLYTCRLGLTALVRQKNAVSSVMELRKNVPTFGTGLAHTIEFIGEQYL